MSRRRVLGKNAAVYLRVSKLRQNTTNQRPECLALCKAQGWRPRVFTETATGRKTDRRVWASVLRRATRGEFSAVVVWSVDRMGRNYFGVTDSVRMLDQADVLVATVKEPWILELEQSPMRSLVVAILGAMAELEGRRIRERIQAGLVTARAKGRRLGRPPVLTGAPLELAGELRRQGQSWNAIREALHAANYRPDPKRRSRMFAAGTVRSAVQSQGTEGG